MVRKLRYRGKGSNINFFDFQPSNLKLSYLSTLIMGSLVFGPFWMGPGPFSVQCNFYLKFYRVSSWWTASDRVGACYLFKSCTFQHESLENLKVIIKIFELNFSFFGSKNEVLRFFELKKENHKNN